MKRWRLSLPGLVLIFGSACTAHVWVAQLRPDGGVIAHQNDGRADFDAKFRDAARVICGDGAYKRVREVERTTGQSAGDGSPAAVPGVAYGLPVPKGWKETEIRCAAPSARRPLVLTRLVGQHTQPDAEKACGHQGAHLPTRQQLDAARVRLTDEDSDVWTLENQGADAWKYDLVSGAAFLEERDEELPAYCVKSSQ